MAGSGLNRPTRRESTTTDRYGAYPKSSHKHVDIAAAVRDHAERETPSLERRQYADVRASRPSDLLDEALHETGPQPRIIELQMRALPGHMTLDHLVERGSKHHVVSGGPTLGLVEGPSQICRV